MDLGVDGWPTSGPVTVAAPREPTEPGAPAWWGTGENPDAFLAQMGVVLE